MVWAAGNKQAAFYCNDVLIQINTTSIIIITARWQCFLAWYFLRQGFIWLKMTQNLLNNWKWPSTCLYHRSSVIVGLFHQSLFDYILVGISDTDSIFLKCLSSSFSKVYFLPIRMEILHCPYLVQLSCYLFWNP